MTAMCGLDTSRFGAELNPKNLKIFSVCLSNSIRAKKVGLYSASMAPWAE